MSEEKTTVSWDAVPGSITYLVVISASIEELAERAKEALVKASGGDRSPERHTRLDLAREVSQMPMVRDPFFKG